MRNATRLLFAALLRLAPPALLCLGLSGCVVEEAFGKTAYVNVCGD